MKKDYFNEIDVRLEKYGKVHKDSYRVAAFKMIVWNLLFLIQPLSKKKATISQELNSAVLERKENELSIAMVTSGGIGDHLLFANYLYCFLQKYGQKNIFVDVFFKDKFGIASHIFKEGGICRKYYEYNGVNELKERYDLVMNLAGFPAVEHKNAKKIERLAPVLAEYLEKCEEYKRYCRNAFRGNAYGMSRLCELEGRRLIQRADVYGMLGMDQQYHYPLFIDEDEQAYLQTLGLESKKFITIQTGCDVIYDTHVKLWPIENYVALVKMIEKNYPDLKIVQIGNSGKRCKEEAPECNVIDMVNQTNLEQAKVLLKHSRLHIDIEGGMVHLRYALGGGKSIVLFGPTSVEFFGYDVNCNIRSDVCSTSCYQMTEAWPLHCPKDKENVLCMEAITPEMVYEKFVDSV